MVKKISRPPCDPMAAADPARLLEMRDISPTSGEIEMDDVRNKLVAAVLFAGALGLAILIDQYAQPDRIVSLLAGAFAFGLGWEAYRADRHKRHVHSIKLVVEELESASTVLSESLKATQTRLTRLSDKVEHDNSQRSKRIVSEMRVLETVVKNLAEAMQRKPVDTESEDTQNITHLRGSTSDDQETSETDLIQRVREALEENRIDLYLQPIVQLPQRKTRYYEALTRLRDQSGALIFPERYLSVAAASGLMPILDNLLLFRCVQVVRKMTEQDREGSIFCNISAYSLVDSEFFPQFIEFMRYNRDLIERLIFEFTQETIAQCGPPELARLSSLAKLGFRFSLDQVTDLNSDWGTLSDQNFKFVKIPAQTLIDGLADAGSPIEASDLKELLFRNGLSLIAEKIENESAIVEILDYDVEWGQGFLFDAPRPVRAPTEEAIDGPQQASA